MIELGSATEDQMVIAFLRGEVESPRFREHYGDAGRMLIQSRDPAAWRALLGEVRGFGRDELLFRGFPSDVKWRRVRLAETDVQRLRYAGHPTWIGLSAGSRSVVDGASNIARGVGAENIDVNVPAIVGRILAGDHFEDLIAVEGVGSDLILVEGHARATAYVRAARLEGVTMLLGSSPSIRAWSFF